MVFLDNKKKIAGILAIVMVLFSGFYVFASVKTNDLFGEIKRPEEAEEEKNLEDLQSEQSEIQNKIEETKAEYQEQVKLFSKQEQELADLQVEIMAQIELIEQTDIDIENKSEEVEAKKLEVNKARADVDNHISALRKRIRAMYKFGKTEYLQIILRSENIVNALTRLDRVRYIAEYDRNLLEELKFLQQHLEEKQAELEDEKKALQDLKETQTQQKEALEASYEQELVKKKQISENMEALERQKKQLEAESEKVAETIRQMKVKRVYVGGIMGWPLDYNYNYITSFFGPRAEPIPGAGTNHGAIDIGAPSGANIYAALSGEVIYSGSLYSYGNMVLIDHGGGIHTLYAHASVRIAKFGDHVNKGDVIAKVGTTGTSTGPHLHFEVRENGTRVDPLNYVVRP